MAAPTKDTPNVVLGRELIHATKQTEELVTLKQSAALIRSQLARIRGQVKDVDTLQLKLQALQQEANERKPKIQLYHDLFDKLMEERERQEVEQNRAPTGQDPKGVEPAKASSAPAPPAAPDNAPSPPAARIDLERRLMADGFAFASFSVLPSKQWDLNEQKDAYFVQNDRATAASPTVPRSLAAGKSLAIRVGAIIRTVDRETQDLFDLAARIRSVRSVIINKNRDMESQKNELETLAGAIDALQRDSAVLDADLPASNGGNLLRIPIMTLGPLDIGGIGRYPSEDQVSASDSLRRSPPPPPRPVDLSSDPIVQFTDAQFSIDELEHNLGVVSKELAYADELMQAMKSRATEVTDGVRVLDDKLSPILQSIQDRLRANQERRLSIEVALGDRDAGLNQFQINQYLVYAVYMMVFSIVALFVLLKWYPATLTDLIVEQRVFVEVLSMGFLLLTVIILGSGKLITGEGLAGLLGTIAGYIFAKKTADMIGASRNMRAVGTVERELMQSRLDLVALQGELDKLQRESGDSPDDKQKDALKKIEQRIAETKARAGRLAESMSIIAQAKLPPRAESDEANG